MARYDHNKIEKKWQEVWDKTNLYVADDNDKREKYYNLVMYPYPSGDLHIGHWYNFSGGDFYARYKRMNGYNVLNPIGFDSFGLPAENAAIKRGIAPKKWTYDNIENMVKQLHRLGPSYDWDRMVVTSDPEYYRWTQWMFLELYKRGLAYKKKQVANWCTDCNTVLANEQVVDGKCERCGNGVIQKDLDQWLFKITDYADELITGLETLDWPERTKTMQRNWIGRSEGAEVEFTIYTSNDKGYEKSGKNSSHLRSNNKTIKVFTTRIDTLFGVTFMVLAPENPLVSEITTKEQAKEVEQYVTLTKSKTELDRMQEKEKSGVFTGSYAINPINNEKIPIWIGDYVLMGYGTGAIMAVPAHDERDWDFAKKFDLSIVEVISPVFTNTSGNEDTFLEEAPISERNSVVALVKHWSEDKYLGMGWAHSEWQGFVIGGIDKGETAVEAGLREITEELGYKNVELVEDYGKIVHSKFYQVGKQENRFAHFVPALFQLRDEQRLPVSDEEKALHKPVWLTKKEMSSFLNREDMRWIWEGVFAKKQFTGYGILENSAEFSGLTSKEAQKMIITKLSENNLASKKVNFKLRDWLISRQRYWGAPIPIVYCEKCGEVPVPEKDLPVVLPSKVKMKPTGESPLKYEKDFYETKCPKCGGSATRETDTMDTFVCSSWYYLRYADPKNDQEFASKENLKHWLPVDMYIGGAEHTVLHLLYSRFFTKALRDGGYLDFDEPFTKLRHQGMILGPDGLKMSKSKGNVIDPDIEVDKYGADAVRMYLSFMGPFEQGGPWNPNGLVGTRRFLDKFYDLAVRVSAAQALAPLSEAKDLDSRLPPRLGEAGRGNDAVSLDRVMAKLINKVSTDLPEMKFNTCVSAFMEAMNSLLVFEGNFPIGQNVVAWKQAISQMLLVMAPFAPHLTEELWENLGNTGSIHIQPWPTVDGSLLVDELITIAVQVNGKVRDSFVVSPDVTEKELLQMANDSEKVAKYVAGKEIKKQIYIKGKILSIVTN